MKKFFMSFIFAVILVIIVINYFSPVLLAEDDSASCKSSPCSCSCSGTACYCIASSGTCHCHCSTGGDSTCGEEEEEQLP